MTRLEHLYGRTIALYLVLAFFSTPHLIDDFLFDIPEEFGIPVHLAQGKRGGVIGAISMGIFLALAEILKHIPLIIQPGPYWSGWFSEGLIFGMIISGIGLAAAGFLELK